MKNEIIYGEAVALNWEAPADGSTTVKVQLSPFGEFTLHDGGKRNGTVQHCSKAAFEALVANWKAMGSPDVLVDVDHASASGGSTEAAAWAKNLRVEDDGLCADFELTPRGRELVEGRTTLAPMPTPEDILAAWNVRKESREAMIRRGGMLHDLDCYVDNCPKIDESGDAVGRNGGIKGRLSDKIPELLPRYKTLMHYKAMVVRLRQATGTGDPQPTSALLDETPRHEAAAYSTCRRDRRLKR
ncbi:MAG: hypothetical protein J6T01_05970 [Kiritimatiellae bacterium]|nr:hypothetical protein [Kiritimatiellia bacterium]